MVVVRIPLQTRFWAKVEKTDGCWNWTGAKAYGYGKIWGSETQRALSAHRLSYEWLVGPIPDGLVIDHLCRNRACVNPAHLEPVTHRENLLRGETIAASELQRAHCVNGHPFSGENLITSKQGWRSCRQCGRDRAREYQRRKRAS